MDMIDKAIWHGTLGILAFKFFFNKLYIFLGHELAPSNLTHVLDMWDYVVSIQLVNALLKLSFLYSLLNKKIALSLVQVGNLTLRRAQNFAQIVLVVLNGLVDDIFNIFNVHVCLCRFYQLQIVICNTKVQIVFCSKFDTDCILEPIIIYPHSWLYFELIFFVFFIEIEFSVFVTAATAKEFE